MNELKAFFKDNKKTVVNAIFLVSLLLGVYIFFKYIFKYISPFVFGWLLSLIFNPFVKFLKEKFKCPRGLGALLSIITLLAFFSIFVVGIVNQISSEFELFVNELPNYQVTFQNTISDLNIKLNQILSLIPKNIREMFLEGNYNLLNIISAFLKQNKTGSSYNFVLAIPNIIFIVILSLISSFFFTKDNEIIINFVKRHIPKTVVDSCLLIKIDLIEALIGYLKAQLILMFFTFIICLVGLLILKSPYSFLLAIIISLIDALPVFGSGFILWPGALIHLIIGNTGLAIGYICIYLVVILMRQILQPKILGTQIGLHPLITLISMFLGLKILGVIGMILGPIIAVLLLTIQEIRMHPGKTRVKKTVKKSIFLHKKV